MIEDILNAILAELKIANARTGAQPMQSTQAAGVVQPAPATVVQPAQQALAPVPQGVNGEMITALIQPHVGNEAIKTELGTVMRAMGINALPETQPHQYADLYQRFQGVLARAGVGGVVQAAQAAASII